MLIRAILKNVCYHLTKRALCLLLGLGMTFALASCTFLSQLPVAIAMAAPTAGEAPLTVQFDGSQSFDPDGTIVTFSWDFDDGSAVATGQTVSHQFANEGIFIVVLTVTDDKGGKDSDTVSIQVGESSIYFSSNRTGNSEIFRMDTDGNNQAQVTSNPNSDRFPSLVPNTRDKLAFTSDRDTPGVNDIFVSNPDGTLPSNLTSAAPASNEIQPTWSPDGAFLAFASDRVGAGVFEIFVMTASGVIVSGGDPLVSQSPSYAVAPAWKPVVLSETATSETHELVFVRFDPGTTDTDLMKVQFTINLTTPPTITGVTVSNLVVDAAFKDGAIDPLGGLTSTPSWKPDGTRIAFTRQVAPGNLDIFTLKSDGSDLKGLNAECFSGNADQAGSNEFDPFWIQNGDIAFTSDRTASDQIFKVDCTAGSGVVTQLTSLGANVQPAGEERQR